jgi:hypothetical protein
MDDGLWLTLAALKVENCLHIIPDFAQAKARRHLYYSSEKAVAHVESRDIFTPS